MKRYLIYTILATMLAACSADGPDAPEDEDDDYTMRFRFVTYSLSRTQYTNGGVMVGKYPNPIVSAYYTDPLDGSSFYFTNKALLVEATSWEATYFYWPLQGTMDFVNYYSPAVSALATLTEVDCADGVRRPMLTINAGALDGYHDFLYIAEEGIKCPQTTPVTLPIYHGLSWINMKLYAQVYEADNTTPDPTKTHELHEALTVHKVSLEDCARGGTAKIMPSPRVDGLKTRADITWSIPTSRIKDQLYKYNSSRSEYQWVEVADASSEVVSTTIPVHEGAADAPFLGQYSTDNSTNYSDTHGLFIIPQRKTAIIVDYSLRLNDNQVIRRKERFVLRDNGYWLPGCYYNYNIVFRNWDDMGAHIEMIPEWTEILYDNTNLCYKNGAFGTFTVDNNGTVTTLNPLFVIDPLHNGGSATGDDMNYKNGGKVF